MRLMRLLMTSAVLAAPIVGVGAAPANAQILCEQATISGSLGTPPADASWCDDQIIASMCVYQHEAVDSTLSAAVFLCVPAPLVGTTPPGADPS